MLKIALALAAVASAPAPVHAAPSADAAPVIAAEQAFAARASEVGVNRSFLEFMAEGAFIFAPGPVSAKAFYSAMPPGKPPKSGGTLLAWWPNFAARSRRTSRPRLRRPALLPCHLCLFSVLLPTLWLQNPTRLAVGQQRARHSR